MGLALAEAAARRGAEVTLVAANVALPSPPGVRRVDVETAAELESALAAEFESADVLLMAAAPADFRPADAAEQKIAREGSGGIELDLEPTEDILAALGGRRQDGQTLVGFAAETGGEVDRAREKLERKGVDAIVYNDVSRPEIGFESEQNEVTIVDAGGEHAVPMAEKAKVADAILDHVVRLRKERASTQG
jgi:phosphopantothenoylcysteine decarboxylase / phosphopantothenate---cysteine ligase